jgi:leucyl/phenylalanyl-tRNA--protein transferase
MVLPGAARDPRVRGSSCSTKPRKRNGVKRFLLLRSIKILTRWIRGCAASKREGQLGGTWIDKDFIRVYSELNRKASFISVEAWDSDGNLAVACMALMPKESFVVRVMFYLQPNASKLALLFLIDRLQKRGSTWLDAQVMTDHMQASGQKRSIEERFSAIWPKDSRWK